MARRGRAPIALDAARCAALRGETEAALPAIRDAAERGDPAASATLAELLAYLGRWDAVVAAAARHLADPFTVYAGNVFDDMARLAARAGQETGRWGEVAEAARSARRAVDARLDRDDLGWHPTKMRSSRAGLRLVLDRLDEYASGGGRAGPGGAPDDRLVPRPSRAPDPAAYGTALAKAHGRGVRYRLALAATYRLDDEAVRLAGEADAAEEALGFDHRLDVARALTRAGEADAAWREVERAWPDWHPVDWAQVAPCVLLTDPVLEPVVTRERAAALLARARAPHLRGPRTDGGRTA